MARCRPRPPRQHCRSLTSAPPGRPGKFSLAIWDHWVPTGDAALKKLVDAWAEKNKVEVQLDFLTSIGEKINITMAAEAQARTGHDIYAFDMWTVHEYADKLTPVDDVMKTLTDKYGKSLMRTNISGSRTGRRVAGCSRRLGIGAADDLRRISMLKQYAGDRRPEMVPGREVHA